MRKSFVFLIAAAALLVGGPLAIIATQRRAAAHELDRQLQLARAEGLITNAEEMQAAMPAADLADNAAPIYRELLHIANVPSDIPALDRELVLNPSKAHIAAASAALAKAAEWLEVSDRALAKPHCCFQRDWSEGPQVLLPEYAKLKTLGKLLGLRASLKLIQGDSSGAFGDIERMMRLAKQAGEEPIAIAALVEESIQRMALNHLELWMYADTRPQRFASQAESILERLRFPNLAMETRDKLYLTLWILDHAETPDGRADMGIKEGDLSVRDRYAGVLADQTRARIKLVEAFRSYHRALSDSSAAGAQKMADANRKLADALDSFPIAGAFRSSLFGSDDPFIERVANWKARLLQHRGLLRALRQKPIPTSIRTDDLLSQFDGVKLLYRFDGSTIRLIVSAGAKDPMLREFPPPPQN